MIVSGDVWRGIALGTLQGVTEFLPISSDGHLAIGRKLLAISDGTLAATVLLHLGTLVATLIVFRREVATAVASIFQSIRAKGAMTDPAREALAVVVASVPTAAIGLALEARVEAWSDDLRIVGAFLFVSAAFVAWTRYLREGALDVLPVRSACLVGVVQGLAVLPGWSRSGSTIAVAMALGLSPLAAFRYSFLLSLVAVGGACLLELRHAAVWSTFGIAGYVGAAVSFLVGLLALHLLRGVVTSGRFAWFAPYLVLLGTAVLVVSFQG